MHPRQTKELADQFSSLGFAVISNKRISLWLLLFRVMDFRKIRSGLKDRLCHVHAIFEKAGHWVTRTGCTFNISLILPPEDS